MVLFRNGMDKNWFRAHFSLSFPTCKRSFSFWNRSVSFFPEPVVLVQHVFTVSLVRFTPSVAASCAVHLRGNMADKKKRAAPQKAATKAIEPWKDYEVEMLFVAFFQKHFPKLSHTLLLRSKLCSLLSKRRV